MEFNEAKLSRGDFGSRKAKAKAFEFEMDRLQTGIKHAKSESDLAEHKKFKKYVVDKYNKYNWKEIRG